MEFSEQSRLLLGEILIQRQKITQKQLDEALKIQQNDHSFIGEILVGMGLVDERDIVVALVVQCGLPYISVNKYDIEPTILKLIPEGLAREHHIVPLDRIGDVVSVVMTNPLTDDLRQKLETLTSCRIATFISTRTEIDEAIARCYKKGS
jgi:type IV pilus assembly protein PilB